MQTEQIFGKIFDYKLNETNTNQNIEIEKKNYDFSAESNSQNEFFESGIKVIDVFTPLYFGCVSKLSGASWCGKLFLEMELIRNFLKTQNGKVVWLAVEEKTREWQDILLELKESNLTDDLVSVLVKSNDSQEIFAEALANTLSLAEELSKNEKVFLFIDDRVLNENFKFLPKLENVLTVVSCFPEHTNSQNISFDSEIILEKKLAKMGLYPAFDVIESESKMLGEAQKEVSAKVRELFLQEGFPEFSETSEKAQKILNFFTQLFFVAQFYTGKPGVFVRSEKSLEGFKELLQNDFPALNPKDFLYKGNLESITETA